MSDIFWSIKQQEEEQERKIRLHLASIEAEIQVVQRCMALRNAPGFQDAVKSIERLRDVLQHKVNNATLDDGALREARGTLRGVSEILTLLTTEKVIDQLAEQRQEAQNALADAMRRRPKPQPTSTP